MSFFDGIGAALSFIGGERRNAAAEDQANNQMAFQERMSSTAHQRQVNDLIAAGINPMLSAKLGGASSPAGAQAPMQDTITPAVQAYQQQRLNSAQVANIEADTRNKDVTTDLIRAQTIHTQTSANQAQAETLRIGATTDYIRSQINFIENDTERVKVMITVLDAQRKLMIQQGLTQLQQENVLRETVKNIIADTQNKGLMGKLYQLDVSAAESFGNLGRESQQLRPIFDIIRGVLGSMRR